MGMGDGLMAEVENVLRKWERVPMGLEAAEVRRRMGLELRLLMKQKNKRDPLRAALAELVELKDGPRNADYHARKPAAWDAARAALSATDAEETPHE